MILSLNDDRAVARYFIAVDKEFIVLKIVSLVA